MSAVLDAAPRRKPGLFRSPGLDFDSVWPTTYPFVEDGYTPAVLTPAATVDLLSEGRLRFG